MAQLTLKGVDKIGNDKVFNWIICTGALGMLALAFGMAMEIWREAGFSVSRFGWSFLFSRDWNPVAGNFGALAIYIRHPGIHISRPAAGRPD